MIQIYVTFIHLFFFFNIQRTGGYKWTIIYCKAGLHRFVDILMQLTLKNGNSQINYCIL
jgi:hypothetical protein